MRNLFLQLNCCRVAVAVIFFFPLLASAQSEGWARHFVGKVGNKDVEIDLTYRDNAFQGHSWYPAEKTAYFLGGEYSGEGPFDLAESTEESQVGTFSFMSDNKGGFTISYSKENGNGKLVGKLDPDLSGNSLQFKAYPFQQTQNLFDEWTNAEETPPSGSIALFYLHPSRANGPANLEHAQQALLRQFFGDAVCKDPEGCLKTSAKDFFDGYFELKQDTSADMYAQMFVWDQTVNSYVMMNRGGFVCMARSEYSYMGGAHGNSWDSYLILDLKTNQILGYEDIFSEDENTEKGLSRLLEDKLRERFGLEPDAPLTEVLFEESLKASRTIYISSSGIGFFYNPYEVAPYASGPIDLFVPLKDIKKFVLPGSPVTRLF